MSGPYPKYRARLDRTLPHCKEPHSAYTNLRVDLINALAQCAARPDLIEDYGALLAQANGHFAQIAKQLG
jgi:hypothetical protein